MRFCYKNAKSDEQTGILDASEYTEDWPSMTKKGSRDLPMQKVTRRPRAAGGRPHSVRLTLSADEAAAIRTAAAAAGMAEAAWVGLVVARALNTRPGSAFSRARNEMQELMGLRAELMELRRVLRNVGGNLNDVAKHANSTGELHTATASVQQLVARVVQRVVGTVGRVDELAAATLAQWPRGGRP